MAFNYTATAATADRLLKRFGASAQVTRSTPGAYDPATGSVSVTTTTQSVTAAVFDYDHSYIDGTRIQQGDRRAFVSAVGVWAPKQGDVLAWAGAELAVVAAKPLAPAGLAVLYELQVRGA